MLTHKQIKLPYPPRPEQLRAVEDYRFWIDGDHSGPRILYSSPTGTGKSIIELACLSIDPQALLITPRLEIVAGMLEKCGEDCSSWSTEKLTREAMFYRITTPIRLRNLLAKGEFPLTPERLLVDEAHHSTADTYRDVEAYWPHLRWCGFTATPFRGTPKGTVEFLDQWGGGYTEVLGIKDASRLGYVEIPDVVLWPLVDDELIAVNGGEFVVAETGNAVASRLGEVVERCRQFVSGSNLHGSDNADYPGEPYWDRPTIFAVPTTDNVIDLVERLNAAGLPAVGVTQDTPREQRVDAFASTLACRTALVQIDVVSEGVDLHVRRLIDLRPTMSPVKWMQQIGRIGRPRKGQHEPGSIYVCCNRNLERHGYLYDGMIPPARIVEAQQAFPAPSSRAQARAIGIEGIGRFAPTEVRLADGATALMYNLTAMDKFARTEYAVLAHPAYSDVVYAQRVSARDEAGSFTWGRWERIDTITDVRGYKSAPPKDLTPKQRAWWDRDAKRYGLHPNMTVNRKNFAVLPLLKDTGARFV